MDDWRQKARNLSAPAGLRIDAEEKTPRMGTVDRPGVIESVTTAPCRQAAVQGRTAEVKPAARPAFRCRFSLRQHEHTRQILARDQPDQLTSGIDDGKVGLS